MNHGRENGRRKKPIKSRPKGYKGGDKARLDREKDQERILLENRSKAKGEFLDYLHRRFGIKKKSED